MASSTTPRWSPRRPTPTQLHLLLPTFPQAKLPSVVCRFLGGEGGVNWVGGFRSEWDRWLHMKHALLPGHNTRAPP
eukprot:gene19857-23567_t